jgi:hypothetical protein
VRRNEPVKAARDRHEPRHLLQQLQHAPWFRCKIEEPKNRIGTARDGSVGLNELNGALKRFSWDFRKLLGDFLEGAIFHAATGSSMPARNPLAADIAVAIVDQEWPFTRPIVDARFRSKLGHGASKIERSIQRQTSNVERRTSSVEDELSLNVTDRRGSKRAFQNLKL